MTPSRPYIMRALYEWILDNETTPYVLVDANILDVQVPMEHVNDGQIVLNTSPNAVRDFSIENDALSFTARFSGVSQYIYVPMSAVLAIYAKENGEGMVFGNEAGAPDPEVPPPPPPKKEPIPFKRPSLSVVK